MKKKLLTREENAEAHRVPIHDEVKTLLARYHAAQKNGFDGTFMEYAAAAVFVEDNLKENSNDRKS